ncbi:MAG: Na(+)/H(+) antiporter subunit D [Alphaproteobacteria bacterium]|nr:Na(+)/H(+) antiporter subunit D [Alphaproteobacteria bacterium]
MIAELPPGLILIVGALLIPLLRPHLRPYLMLALPVAALVQLLTLPAGLHAQVDILGHSLVFLRIDGLSFVFGLIFLIAAVLNVIYGWHEDDPVQQVSGLVYAGAAVGAVFVGDLVSLFVFWELTAIASVFLIWASRTERAYRAGMRYLLVQIGSGVILLAGVILHYRATGSIAFDRLELTGLPTALILFAFGIKCAFPLLHNWLQDAYPEATVVGTVILSAFTTKLAAYALARSFAGTDMLIWIGAIMAVFPIVYAVIENDLRRVMAYILNNQLGFMVVGVGIGTPLALNGVAALAFCGILYKALLFMCLGAVLFRAGSARASDLGGLWKSMPWTTGFCIVGGASISAVPLFAGFIAKSMVLAAVAEGGHWIVWLVLLAASAGVFHQTGLRIPYAAFFARNPEIRCREAPLNMLAAMGITSLLCIAIGVYPAMLYAVLPYQVDFAVYTASHVVTQLQLLAFAALAFSILLRHRVYPQDVPSINLDSDWIYRRLLPAFVDVYRDGLRMMRFRAIARAQVRLNRFIAAVYRHHGPQGVLARTWPVGSTVLWVAVLLCVTLVFYYIE